jgi:hypothetical protein
LVLASFVFAPAACTPAPSGTTEPGENAQTGGKAGSSAQGGSGGAGTGTGGKTSSPAGSGGAGGNAVDPPSPPSGSGGAGGTSPSEQPADAAPAPGDAGTAMEASEGNPGSTPSVPTPGEGRLTDPLKQLLISRGIGLGYYHSCHLLENQTIKCFNTGTDARFHPPNVKSTQINCAHDGCCVLTGGDSTLSTTQNLTSEGGDGIQYQMIQAKRLACWSHKRSFFPPMDLDMDPIWFGIGYDHGCALNKDHSVTCWGNPGAKPTPPAVVNQKKVKVMAVASFFNCAVLMDDSVECWGVNPPMPPAGLKAKLVAGIFHSNPKLPLAPTGTRHACAIQLDDTLKCWGDNVEGTTDVPADLGPVKDVALATYNSCALKLDGEPRCWGTKRYNDIMERWHPMPDPKTMKLKGIRAKLAAYCGLRMDNTMVCWGDESSTHLTIPAGTKFFTTP